MTYDTSGQMRELDGGLLADDGLRVNLPSGYTSELLLFEALKS